MTTPDRDETKFIYIETSEEKRAHAPKRATDEFWSDFKNQWTAVSKTEGFGMSRIYRRALPVPAENPVDFNDRPYIHEGLLYELDQLAMHHRGEAGESTCREAIYNIRTLRRDLASREDKQPPQPAQEPDADAEGWIDASKRQPPVGEAIIFVPKECDVKRGMYEECGRGPSNFRFYDADTNSYFEKVQVTHWQLSPPLPPAPRAETQYEIDRKIAEALWLKIPGDVGARKTDYIAGVLDGLKAERERAKP